MLLCISLSFLTYLQPSTNTLFSYSWDIFPKVLFSRAYLSFLCTFSTHLGILSCSKFLSQVSVNLHGITKNLYSFSSIHHVQGILNHLLFALKLFLRLKYIISNFWNIISDRVFYLAFTRNNGWYFIILFQFYLNGSGRTDDSIVIKENIYTGISFNWGNSISNYFFNWNKIWFSIILSFDPLGILKCRGDTLEVLLTLPFSFL